MDYEFIDIHAHLDMNHFQEDLEDVISNARKSSVLIVSSGINSSANRKVLELSKMYENVFASFGIYPIDGIIKQFPNLKDDGPREILPLDIDLELDWIFEHKNDCLFIGEVGLDFKVIKVNEEIKNAQKENFEKIIQLANKIDKPLLIHSRGAELECIELLEKYSCKKVIMHCFNGKKSLIKRIIDNGWFLTVPAVITRLEHFKMLVNIVPLNQLLTETDSPYLSPVAMTRNEPKNVLISIEEIAKIKNLSFGEVKENIFNNAKKLLSF